MSMIDYSDDKSLLISVIIPVYRVESYIDRFLKSLVSQTIQNFRAIFVNDSTPDDSMLIVEQYREYFRDRLIVINNEKNLGLSDARNVGLDYVKDNPTKYITFMDPDDWMDSGYLEDLYSNAKKFDLDLCISGLVRFNENTKKVICTEMVNMKGGVFESPGECKELAYINPCAYSKLYLFDPIKNLRFRKIKRSEDTCYLFESLKIYKRIMFTNNAMYHYCVRDASLTGLIDEEKYYSMHEMFSELLLLFDGNDLEEVRDELITQIFIRSSIGGVCRLSFMDMKKACKMEKIEHAYLDKCVPSWRNNRYLCFGKSGIGGRKEFALRICALLYKMHCFALFIWTYFVFTRLTGKDFRA